MQQTKKFKMADAISPYLAVSCGLRMCQLSPHNWQLACQNGYLGMDKYLYFKGTVGYDYLPMLLVHMFRSYDPWYCAFEELTERENSLSVIGNTMMRIWHGNAFRITSQTFVWRHYDDSLKYCFICELKRKLFFQDRLPEIYESALGMGGMYLHTPAYPGIGNHACAWVIARPNIIQVAMDLILTCYTKDNQQGCFRLSKWFPLRRLGPWMNHLPLAW